MQVLIIWTLMILLQEYNKRRKRYETLDSKKPR